MTLTRDDVIRIKTAKAAARAAGMFVVEKFGKFLLYRENKPHNIFVGESATPAELQQRVARAAATAPQPAGARP